MEQLNEIIAQIDDFVWGPVMLVLLVGTGIFLTFRTRFLTWRNLGYALKSTLSKEARTKSRGEGDVSPFSALTTALAATIGTGNIVGVATAMAYPFCQQPLSGNCHSICFSKPVLWTATPKRCFSFWRSGRDSNPRTAFGRHTISSRARYDHFDTTAYLNAQQQASLYQNWARSQYPIFAFPQKRDGAALRLFSFCLYFNCSSAASFRQQQKTSIACCSSSTGGRDGATRILLSFGSTP